MMKRAIWLSLAALVMFGCGKEDEQKNTTPDMAMTDMATGDMGADMSGADMGGDMGADMDDTADMDMAPAACDFPKPRLGTFPAAQALAAKPARCGMPAYEWINAESLGDVVDPGTPKEHTRAFLKASLNATGVKLPAEPQYNVAVRQIEYSTQDRGQVINATAGIAYPKVSTPPDKPFPILLLLHGTAGFTDQCAPSNDTEAQLLIAAVASLGYIVVGPDYIGLKGKGEPTGFLHPYLVGEVAAISSLDAARAAGKMTREQLGGGCADTELLVLGGSQGGHAALWVDRLAPYYAPEFTLQGTVATVPPADMMGQVKRALANPVEASANTIAFYTASAGWYGAGDRLDEVFIEPLDAELPDAFSKACDPSDELTLDIKKVMSLDEVFQSSFLDGAATLEQDETWGCMIAENGLTTTTLPRVTDQGSYSDNYGIFWILGENDTLVHTPLERESFKTLCAQGMSMRFLECAGASHTRATAWSLPEILTFFAEQHEGKAWDTTTACQVNAPSQCSGTPAE